MRTRARRSAAQSGTTLRGFAGPEAGPWWGHRPAGCEDGEQGSSDTKLPPRAYRGRTSRQPGWNPLTGKTSCESSWQRKARALTPRMTEALGQPIVVENRPGAGGTIGTDVVAKAAPDGHTLLMATAAHTITAATYERLPFDARADFAPVTRLVATLLLLVVHPFVPAATVPELVARARAEPGEDLLRLLGPRHLARGAPEWFICKSPSQRRVVRTAALQFAPLRRGCRVTLRPSYAR